MSDAYDPRTFQARTFHDVTESFADNSDTPRKYLERCLEVIALREPTVQAFATFNEKSARAAAPQGGEGSAHSGVSNMVVPTRSSHLRRL